MLWIRRTPVEPRRATLTQVGISPHWAPGQAMYKGHPNLTRRAVVVRWVNSPVGCGPRLSPTGPLRMEAVLQYLRYAARRLARTPAFTLIAVATLAVAIGASTA